MKYNGPFVYPTVDVAVFDATKMRILLARKSHEKRFQFIGGFSDVSSESYEADAAREVTEEANIYVDRLEYMGSVIIDDERYKNSPNKIKTLFFRAIYNGGIPIGKDDVAEVKWFRIDKLKESDILL